jgi:hypothetical protein
LGGAIQELGGGFAVTLEWGSGVGDKVGGEGTNGVMGVFPPLSLFVVQIAL